jgi:hypothetical protein
MRRRAQIARPDRRRNRYPLSSAEGFFTTIRRLPPAGMRKGSHWRRRGERVKSTKATFAQASGECHGRVQHDAHHNG